LIFVGVTDPSAASMESGGATQSGTRMRRLPGFTPVCGPGSAALVPISCGPILPWASPLSGLAGTICRASTGGLDTARDHQPPGMEVAGITARSPIPYPLLGFQRSFPSRHARPAIMNRPAVRSVTAGMLPRAMAPTLQRVDGADAWSARTFVRIGTPCLRFCTVRGQDVGPSKFTARCSAELNLFAHRIYPPRVAPASEKSLKCAWKKASSPPEEERKAQKRQKAQCRLPLYVFRFSFCARPARSRRHATGEWTGSPRRRRLP
jgi:hypothetical protein